MRQLSLILFAIIVFATVSLAQSTHLMIPSMSSDLAGPAYQPGIISVTDKLRFGEPRLVFAVGDARCVMADANLEFDGCDKVVDFQLHFKNQGGLMMVEFTDTEFKAFYQQDGHRYKLLGYDPGSGWKRLPDSPMVVVLPTAAKDGAREPTEWRVASMVPVELLTDVVSEQVDDTAHSKDRPVSSEFVDLPIDPQVTTQTKSAATATGNKTAQISKAVAARFTLSGHQKLDWTKGHPHFNKAMHWFSLSAATAGTFLDGLESRKIIEDIVQDKQTGAVTVICEANKTFAQGCGFKTRKFVLLEGALAVAAPELIRPYVASISDMIEIFWAIQGFRNFATGRSLVNVNKVNIIGHK